MSWSLMDLYLCFDPTILSYKKLIILSCHIEWKEHYNYAEETHTKKDWGDFLPDRVRQMLLNMSQYFFDDILAADSLDPILANEKFFAAYKVFI